MSTKIGTEFENQVQNELDKLRKMSLLSYVRLYDTKSARGLMMPKQPGDFIIGAGTAHLLECKASAKYNSLAEGRCLKDNVKPHQAAAARLWRKAGNMSWFLFHSLPAQRIELWNGQMVGEAYVGKCQLTSPDIDVSSTMLGDLLFNMFKHHKENSC